LDETLVGTEEDDLIEGGFGNDTLVGGLEEDTLNDEEGNDQFFGNEGDDTLIGGEGRYVFYNVAAGGVIDGGEVGDDFDRINLDSIVKAGGSFSIVRDPDTIENGEILLTDANGDAVDSILFSNIEKVVPCFTPGTRIATPRGEVEVQDLKPGERTSPATTA
jgi:Ca2+-binding RTX toxin-like protein